MSESTTVPPVPPVEDSKASAKKKAVSSTATETETEKFVIVQAGNAWFAYHEDEIGEVRNKVDYLRGHKELKKEQIAAMLLPSRTVVSTEVREDGCVIAEVTIVEKK